MRVDAPVRSEDVEIASPCEEAWDAMRPEDGGRRRWCDRCDKQVHDLSQLGEAAARALLRASEGREICVAFLEDARGELVVPAPAPIVPLARVRRRPLVEAAKLASAASVAALLGACTPQGEPDRMLRIEAPADATMLVPDRLIPSTTETSPPTVVEVEPPVAEPCEPTAADGYLRRKGGRKAPLRRVGLPLGRDDSAPGGL